MEDKPQLTDIQEGLRDVIRYQEEMGGILKNLQDDIDTILQDHTKKKSSDHASHWSIIASTYSWTKAQTLLEFRSLQ